MHAAIYRARMTEDTFQILLDVMERHFAALSLPDPANDPKITRAISFSELPSTRRILIEQCYQADDSGILVRQYSCEQIFDKLSNSREVKVSEVVRSGSERCLSNTWSTTLPVFGALGNAGWRNGHFGQIEPDKSRKMESMEVEEIDVKSVRAHKRIKKSWKKLPIMELNGMTLSDVDSGGRKLVKASTIGSLQMGEEIDFSKPFVRSRSASPKKSSTHGTIIKESKFTEIPKTRDERTVDVGNGDCNEKKKKIRSLIPERTVNSRNSRLSCTCYKFIFFVLLSISMVILAIFLYDEDTTRHRGLDNLNIANMSMELRDRVYGQERAIDELIKELRKSSTGINLVALIGGTGVGKSYTIGIVAKYFSPLNCVSEYFSPLRKTIHEAFATLSRRHCNLIILENLRETDLPDVAKFFKFMKEYTRQMCVYTFAVFSPQEGGNDLSHGFDPRKSVNDIDMFFRESDLDDARVIVFEDLDEESLDACIREAANEKNINLSHDKLMEIRENLMIAGSGCKGAYAKVQLLIES